MIKFKLFFDPLSQIEPWLNKMAADGYRLTSVNNCFYNFEPSGERFFYSTRFIGAQSSRENMKYINTLAENGCKTFRAPVNQVSFIFGKLRNISFGGGHVKAAASFSNYSQEILVVESGGKFPDGLPISGKEVAEQYRASRNSCIKGACVSFLLGTFAAYKGVSGNWDSLNIVAASAFDAGALLLCTLAMKYHSQSRKYDKAP